MYFLDHPYGLVPVAVNDVVFALHALFACIVTVAQCFIYEVGATVEPSQGWLDNVHS